MKKDRDAKRKRTVQIVLGLFIVLIMTMSVLELALYNTNTSGLNYGKYRFSVDQSTQYPYRLKVNKQTYSFRSFPSELLDINVTPETGDILKNAQRVVYTFDPETFDQDNRNLIEEVRYRLSQQIPIPFDLAVMRNVTPYESLPVFTCADAQPAVPVIVFANSTNQSIISEGSCIIVSGEGLGFFRLRDRLLYAYLGVMGGQ